MLVSMTAQAQVSFDNGTKKVNIGNTYTFTFSDGSKDYYDIQDNFLYAVNISAKKDLTYQRISLSEMSYHGLMPKNMNSETIMELESESYSNKVKLRLVFNKKEDFQKFYKFILSSFKDGDKVKVKEFLGEAAFIDTKAPAGAALYFVEYGGAIITTKVPSVIKDKGFGITHIETTDTAIKMFLNLGYAVEVFIIDAKTAFPIIYHNKPDGIVTLYYRYGLIGIRYAKDARQDRAVGKEIKLEFLDPNEAEKFVTKFRKFSKSSSKTGAEPVYTSIAKKYSELKDVILSEESAELKEFVEGRSKATSDKASTGGSITIGGKTYYKYKDNFYDANSKQVCNGSGGYEFSDKTVYKTTTGIDKVVSKNGKALFYNDLGNVYSSGSKTLFINKKGNTIYKNGSEIGTYKSVSSTNSNFSSLDIAVLVYHLGL